VRFLRQAILLTLCALRSLNERRWSALVTIISVTTVVGVLVSLLAIREGSAVFGAQYAPPDLMVVMGRGARTPFASVLSRETVQIVSQAPGVKKDPDGRPHVYWNVLAPVDAVRKDGRRGTLFVVGYSGSVELVEPDVRVIAGRWYEHGVHELIIPEPVRKMYKGMEVGNEILLHGAPWKIVGIFVSRNPLSAAFLRGDADSVMPAFGLNHFQQMNLRLESPAAVEPFKRALAANPAIAVDVKSRAQLNEQTFGATNRLLDYIAYSVGGVMALGAIFGAVNALYASIDARRRELATLRAMGFNSGSIIVSVLAESTVLALPGAIVGSLLAWWLFSGNVVSTNGRIFNLSVTWHLVQTGVLWTLAIGLVGGLLPAIRAIRLPVATALQET
jgi:putative ABC transport system permease protein